MRPSEADGDLRGGTRVPLKLNSDLEAVQRALRAITHIDDGDVVKALKGILERQARMLAWMTEADERIAALQACRSSP
jgi:hypothetical protein